MLQLSLNDLGMNSVNFKKELRDTTHTRGSEDQTAVFVEQRASELLVDSQRKPPSSKGNVSNDIPS